MLDLVEKYSTFDDNQRPKAFTEEKGSEDRDEVVVRIRPDHVIIDFPFHDPGARNPEKSPRDVNS